MARISTLITKLIDYFYRPPVQGVISLQVFRYGVCGGVNMVWDLVLYHIIYQLLGGAFLDLGFVVVSPHILALIIVFPITFFNGFWLNKYVAFRNSPLRTPTQLGRYLLSVGGSLLINYLFLKLFVEVCHIYPTPSKALTTAISVAYSYLMQKHFTFRGSEK